MTTSPEGLASAPVIPASASHGPEPVPVVGASDKAPVAHTGQGASYLCKWCHGSGIVFFGYENEEGEACVCPQGERQRNPVASYHRKPQRRELSLSVAALAYTWAAVCRRGR